MSRVSSQSIRYCLDSIRRYDHDHYLSNLLLSSSVRDAAHVLRAFNVEISLIDRLTRDQFASRMRLQWWRETIHNIIDNVEIAHPVAQALQGVIHDYALPKHWIMKVIDSRDPSVMDRPQSIKDLEAISDATHSSLLYLILHASDVHDLHADHAASHIGKAAGLALTLQAIPYGYTTNIPRDLVRDPRLKFDGVSPASIDVTYEIASQAKSHIDHAKSFMGKVPSAARPTLLPAVAISYYLDRLETAGFNVFDVQKVNPLRLQLKLLYHRLLNNY